MNSYMQELQSLSEFLSIFEFVFNFVTEAYYDFLKCDNSIHKYVDKMTLENIWTAGS